MPDKCDPIRSKLNALEVKLSKTPLTIPGDPPGSGGPVGKPVPNPEVRRLKDQIKQTRSDLRKCEGPNNSRSSSNSRAPNVDVNYF